MIGRLRTRRLALIALLIPTVTAATSATAAYHFDVRYLLAGLGLFTIGALAKYARARDVALSRFEARVDGALWGPEDANGKRQVEAGIVAVVNRLGSQLQTSADSAEEAAHQAKEAAEAARAAAKHAEEAAAAAIRCQRIFLDERQSRPVGTRNDQ